MAKQTFTAGQVLTAAQMTSLQANDYNWTTSAQTASYVLTAANAGQTVTMTSASATTITVNTALFTAGDTVRILNLGAGACTITAGTATVNTAGSLVLPQYGSGTLWFSSASAAIFIPDDRTSGLTMVKAETSFTSATSVTADNVFTSSYTNYLVNVRYSTSTTQPFYWKLRASGTSSSTNYNSQRLVVESTTTAPVRETGKTAEYLGFTSGGAFRSFTQLVLSGPQMAEATPFFINNAQNSVAYNLPYIGILAGNHGENTSYDGIELLVTTGTVSGSYTIYGYQK